VRILADENCDVVLVGTLRADGHDVLRVVDTLRAADDEAIFQFAIREQRVLLTHDLDFGMISDRSDAHPPAIVLMRLDPLGAASRAAIVSAFLAAIADRYVGKFFVVEPGSTRERFLTAKPL
jgi:predicted nuclease of predicted toxin-antitoxin system